jgi:hypothetical protein
MVISSYEGCVVIAADRQPIGLPDLPSRREDWQASQCAGLWNFLRI